MTVYEMVQVLPVNLDVKVEEFNDDGREIFKGLPSELLDGGEMQEREVVGVKSNLAGIIVLEVI